MGQFPQGNSDPFSILVGEEVEVDWARDISAS
jgi:hypothetical protein